MTISLKHLFQSAVPDDGDANLVQPSNWNAEHVLTLGTGKLVGRSTVGTGAAEEISIGSGLSISGGVLSLTGTISSLTTPVISGGTAASSTLTLQSTSGAGTTDALLFKTGSQVERMRITSSGFVGIGTSTPNSPYSLLNVKHSVGTSVFGLDYYDTGSGGNNINIWAYIENYNNDGYGDGYYGAYARGTKSSPLAVQAGDALSYFGAGGWDGTQFRYPSYLEFSVEGSVSAGNIPTSMVFRAGTTSGPPERMRITSSGRVGIGTSSPNSLLSVVGNLTSGAPLYTNNIQLIAAADEYPQVEVRSYGSTDDAGGFMIYTAGGSPSSQSSRWPSYPYNGYLVWQTYNASNTGNIGTLASIDSIQTGAPTATGNVGALRFFTSDGTIQYGGIERMRIASDGFVGIGTSAPNYPESIFNVRYPVGTSVFGLDRYDSGSGGSNINIWAYVENYNNDGYGEGFYGQYARGTRSSPLVVQPGDELAYFGAGGYDGAGYRWSSQIYYRVDGAVSVGTVPIAMLFKTGTGGAGSVERMRITSAGNVGIGTSSPTQMLTVNGGVGYNAPVTITGATYVVTATDNWLIANYAGTVTLTLPAASSYTGRIINVKTVQAQTVVSNSSDVVPIGSTSAGTAILSATAGAFAKLVSDGTNWVVNEAFQGTVATTLTVGTTATSGGAAGQIMFDTGSVLQESSALTFASNTLQINGANILGGTNSFTLGGAAAAAPSAQTLRAQSVVAGTSNTAGANLTITGSQGTGTGAGGSIIFQTAPAGTAGTAQNALQNSVTIDQNSNILVQSYSNSISSGLGFKRNADVAYNLIFGLSTGNYPYIRFGDAAGGAFITRRGTGNLRFGDADAAAPVAQTLSVQSVVAGTSNTAGANLTITGSQGTGTGAGGDIIFQTAPAGTSGTAQNAFISALKINSNGSISGNAANTFGIIYVQGNQTTFGDSGLSLDQTGVALRSTGAFSWTNGASGLLASRDTFLTRRGAANLRFGAADAAAPVAQTLSVQSVVAGTSNTAGANLTITGSQGTGTGAGGSIIFQVAPAGSSGTAQNALTQALAITSTGQSIFGATPATSLYNAAVDNMVLPQAATVPVLRFISSSTTLSDSGFFVFTRANGNSLSAPTATASGAQIGLITFQTFDGTVRQTSAQILSVTESATTASNAPAYISFLTTAASATTPTEKMRITSAGLITFQGTTSSFPALKRSSTVLQVRLADDSAYAPVEASTVRTATAYTVATLPAAGTAGRRAYVTDATAPTWLGALTGGGTVVCPVFDNGTAWVAG